MPKKVIERGDCLTIRLPSGHTCLLDREDAWILTSFPVWAYCGKYVTVERRILSEWGAARERIYIHRIIMNLSPNSKWQVDHINRNKLDNRRQNLRLASQHQNAANCVRNTISKSGYRGVTKITDRKLKKSFLVHIQGKHYGYFLTAKEAAAHYNKIARQIYGDFAVLNNI